MSNSMVINLTAGDFKEQTSAGVALVDFWAAWCGPCRRVAPAVDALAEAYEGRVKVCKLDVDAFGEIAQAFGVMTIPTLIVFKDGAEAERAVGVRDKAELAALLEKYL